MHILIFFLFLVGGCASKADSENEQAQIEALTPEIIVYRGEISDKNVTLLENILLAPSKDISTLIITSGGGEVFAGMRLGKLVHSYQLKVVVRGICGSSCANYVVTASPSVLVENNAFLGWHGGALQTLYTPIKMSYWDRIKMYLFPKNSHELDTFLANWKKEESSFFQRVNVNQAVTILGMMPDIDEKRDAMLFSYDPRTLQSLGLNIHFEGEQAELSLTGDKIVQVLKFEEQELNQLLQTHKRLNK